MGQKRNNQEFAIRRAIASMACLPFRKAFYEEINGSAISAEELCQRKDWEKILFVPFGPQRADEHFAWMIKLGILRREVDGQGLTSRVRLTPMGRKIISGWTAEIPRAGLRQRILEALRRQRSKL